MANAKIEALCFNIHSARFGTSFRSGAVTVTKQRTVVLLQWGANRLELDPARNWEEYLGGLQAAFDTMNAKNGTGQRVLSLLIQALPQPQPQPQPVFSATHGHEH